MHEREAEVTILKSDYSAILGKLVSPPSTSVTWQWQGVGTAVITVGEGPLSSTFLQCSDYVIPVSIKFSGYPRWTGWVVRAENVKTTGQPGTITANLVSERRWLDRILAAPTPGSPWSSQTTEQDTRTGGIATVARQYVTANVARINALSAPVPDLPIVVTVPPSPDTSPVVTIEARNKPIAEELNSALHANGYDITVNLWLPGDPQPSTASPLSVPTMVVDVVKGRQQNYVNFTDDTGGVASRTVVAIHPQATAILVGGPGEGTARVFDYVVADDNRLTTLGKWGYAEDFLDAVDADTQSVRIQRAREKLIELAGQVSIAVVLDDRRPWKAGPADYDGDYWIGDQVRATFNGVTKTDRIDRLTVSANTQDGFRVAPQFGETSATETSDARVARLVRELAAALQTDRARR